MTIQIFGWALSTLLAAPSLAQDFKWQDANGSPQSVSITKPSSGRTITLAPHAGAADSDFKKALGDLHSGYGTIRLLPGKYILANDPGPSGAFITIARMSDLTITGPSATIILEHPSDGIRIQNSQRIAILGVSIRYDHPGVILGRVISDAGQSKLIIDKKSDSSKLQVSEIREFDRSIGNTPPNAQRQIFGKAKASLSRSGDGSFSGQALNGFQPGTSVAVKLWFYQGAAIRIDDISGQPRSSNITLDHIAIPNSSGLAIVADRMGSGLAITNSSIGPQAKDPPVTIPYDGIHIGASAGGILIANNEIHGTNDDAINIASPLAAVTASGTTQISVGKYAALIEAGSRLTFLDANLKPLIKAVAIQRSSLGSDGSAQVQTSENIPANARFAALDDFSADHFAVSGNDIHNCACRGILAQGRNGIIIHNNFHNLTSNPIRLLGSGLWKEGAGVKNVVVSKNLIENTGSDAPRDITWGAISVYSEVANPLRAGAVKTSEKINDTILISGNVVKNAAQACISVSSATRVSLIDNDCGSSITPAVWIDKSTTSAISF